MRLLIVLPSWVGDAVMATPAVRALREHLPGAFIGALMRPGIDQLLAGCSFFDEAHIISAQGMMGPKRAAARLRARRYDAAVLLTNSFSTALTARLAGIPRRIGYDRDARAVLLTDPVRPLRRRDVEPYRQSPANLADWAPVPACEYYYRLVTEFLGDMKIDPGPMGPLELVATRGEELEAADILARADVTLDGPGATPYILLNPGGNDTAKRWPADRFAALADYLISNHGLTVLVSGSPAEAELIDGICAACRHTGAGGPAAADPSATARGLDPSPGESDTPTEGSIEPAEPTPVAPDPGADTLVVAKPGPRGHGRHPKDSDVTGDTSSAALGGPARPRIVNLARLGVTLSTLKPIVARARVMVTNDTGPRHIAAAFGTPVVTLFGPTDHRWTTIPHQDEVRLLADPTLPEQEVANDHPDRCRIDRIGLGDVVSAVNRLLRGAPPG